MNTDIKHKHSGHVIAINGHTFKANDRGQWNLTDIWQTLKLPKGKQPGQWRTKQAQQMEQMQFLHSLNKGRAGSVVHATKRAALAYAGWVSDEFETMVYDAFEAVLEMPEVAKVVAAKMEAMGRAPSAGQLRDMFGLTERESERLAMSGKLGAYIKRWQASQKVKP
jgi:hypothetical protein